MSQRRENRLRAGGLAFFIILASCVAALTAIAAEVETKPQDKSAPAAFEPTRVWKVHITVSDAEFTAMQPRSTGGWGPRPGGPGNPGARPAPTPPAPSPTPGPTPAPTPPAPAPTRRPTPEAPKSEPATKGAAAAPDVHRNQFGSDLQWVTGSVTVDDETFPNDKGR